MNTIAALEAKVEWGKYEYNVDEFVFFHEQLLKKKDKRAAEIIGNNALSIRKTNGFSVTDLSELMSPNSMYKKEYGERFFTVKDVLKLADVNNVNLMVYYTGLYLVEGNRVTPNYDKFDITPDEEEVNIRSVIRRDMTDSKHGVDYITNKNFAKSTGEAFVAFCKKKGKLHPHTQSLLKRLRKNVYFVMSLRDVSLRVFDGLTPIGSIQRICTGVTIPDVEVHLLPVSELLDVPLQTLMAGMWKVHQGAPALVIPSYPEEPEHHKESPVIKISPLQCQLKKEAKPSSDFFDDYPMFTALREVHDTVAQTQEEKNFITEVMASYLNTFRKE